METEQEATLQARVDTSRFINTCQCCALFASKDTKTTNSAVAVSVTYKRVKLVAMTATMAVQHVLNTIGNRDSVDIAFEFSLSLSAIDSLVKACTGHENSILTLTPDGVRGLVGSSGIPKDLILMGSLFTKNAEDLERDCGEYFQQISTLRL